MISRRLILWRHGRTAWNAERRFQGQTDVPLDDMGHRQAAHAAELLATLSPDRIVSSDLARARETAEALGVRVGLDVATHEGLRETFAGDWEGLTRRELEEAYGDELARWSAGSDVRPGGGETRREVAARVVQVIDAVLAESAPGETIVVATHGGAARAAIGALLELPPEHWAALGVLTNCAWSVLVENMAGPSAERHGPRWRLQEYNAGSLPVAALADDR